MEYRESYEEWLRNPYFDEATKEELRSIGDDDNEIKERFYRERGIRDSRTARRDWRRNKPYEYLYSPQGDSGACQLYYKK